MLTYLVTGAAGFIGFHLAQTLLERGVRVIGVDNLNDYYSTQLKRDRLAQLTPFEGFSFVEMDLADRAATAELFRQGPFDCVLHMAAQAGVRYSIERPEVYIDSNLCGFGNVLEGCRAARPRHLVYASSSSVYGGNDKLPFSVSDSTDRPISLYAATKRANELMAYTYSHLYQLPTTGLRFFTVYGPWGRPDMALYKFTDAVTAGTAIDVYNHGQMRRDFTYVDDVVEGVLRVAESIPDVSESDHASAPAIPPYRLYNIGNHEPVELETLIALIERYLGKEAIRNNLPMQPGDVKATYADVSELELAVNFKPSTPIDEGVRRFVAWYQDYHGGAPSER